MFQSIGKAGGRDKAAGWAGAYAHALGGQGGGCGSAEALGRYPVLGVRRCRMSYHENVGTVPVLKVLHVGHTNDPHCSTTVHHLHHLDQPGREDVFLICMICMICMI